MFYSNISELLKLLGIWINVRNTHIYTVIQTDRQTDTHTHTHTHIYIYICVCVCVCYMTIMISMIIIKIIIMLVDCLVSDTNGFISFCLQPLVTQGERQFIKAYSNHTILTHHTTHTMHLVVSPAHCWLRSKMIWFNQILKFSGPPLPVMTSSTHSVHSNGRPAPFPDWKFILTDDDYHILSVRAC